MSRKNWLATDFWSGGLKTAFNLTLDTAALRMVFYGYFFLLFLLVVIELRHCVLGLLSYDIHEKTNKES